MKPRLDLGEILMMLGILALTASVTYAIIKAAHAGYLMELERIANDTCRDIAGYTVPCSRGEKQ